MFRRLIFIILLVVFPAQAMSGGLCSGLGLGLGLGKVASWAAQLSTFTGELFLKNEIRYFDQDRFEQRKAELQSNSGDFSVEDGFDLLAWYEVTLGGSSQDGGSLGPLTSPLARAKLYRFLRKDLATLRQSGLSESDVWQLAARIYFVSHPDAESFAHLMGAGYRTAVQDLFLQRLEIALLKNRLQGGLADIGLMGRSTSSRFRVFYEKRKDKLRLVLAILLDVPLLISGTAPFFPKFSSLPASVQIAYNPIRRVWNKVALVASLLAVSHLLEPSTVPHAESDGTNNQIGVAEGMDKGIFAEIVNEEMKEIDRRLPGLAAGPSRDSLKRRRATLVSLLSQVSGAQETR